ncbi:hypothetical protein GCM10028807_60490 [Spirosoma daeguense]
MKLSIHTVLLLGGLFLVSPLVLAQDDRTFQAYTKQAKRYESQKDYKQAIAAYRKAKPYATPDASKSIDQSIDYLNELIQQEQLVLEGLSNQVERKIAKLNGPSNRRRFKDDLEKLQQQEDATKADYQQLLNRIDATRQVEIVVENRPPVTPTVVKPTATARTTPKPNRPPPKTVTSSLPGSTHKGSQDLKTAKSADALRPKQ